MVFIPVSKSFTNFFAGNTDDSISGCWLKCKTTIDKCFIEEIKPLTEMIERVYDGKDIIYFKNDDINIFPLVITVAALLGIGSIVYFGIHTHQKNKKKNSHN